jgi:hypothetical protein
MATTTTTTTMARRIAKIRGQLDGREREKKQKQHKNVCRMNVF